MSNNEKKLLDTYTVMADKVPAKIEIWDYNEETVPIYKIELPVLGTATSAMLESLKNSLSTKIPLDADEIIDAKKEEGERARIFSIIRAEILKKMALPENQVDVFAGILLHEMHGLGDLDIIMADNMLEEIAVNGSKQPISVYHKRHGWCKTTKYLKDEAEIYNISSQIGRKIGNDISTLNPIMDSHLLSGDRVASTLFPISAMGNTITIRRFARNPWTAIHFIDPAVNTLSKEIAAFIWLAMQFELNIMVAGGTASGKTSMLNSLCAFIPPTQRVISIEDTREILLPRELYWNWVPLSSRLPNPEGMGAVTMLDLMVASLRMRPDRIVVGEVRRREQAEAMFEAMHTGHSVYSTIHADNVEQVKRRLIEPPIAIPKSEIEALHLILIQYRDRRKGMRRTLELAEVLQGNENELGLHYLYRWQPRTDTFVKVNESIRVIEELNLHTGLTPKEIAEDLKEKQEILEWMLANNLKEVDEVGAIMRYYYKDKQVLMDCIKNNKNPDCLLKKGQ